jgi:hypothetical protein
MVGLIMVMIWMSSKIHVEIWLPHNSEYEYSVFVIMPNF